jgi:F-type H+-transporting ATPase subunit delta
MAEFATLARPYAEAVFELAVETGNFDEWSNNLSFLSTVIEEPSMAKVIANPEIGKHTLTRILLDIGNDYFSTLGQNLVKMLIDNHRLPVTPQIALQYERLKAQHQGYLQVEIASAYPVEPEQQQEIETILQKRLGKAIDITTYIDKSLLGGWLIRTGDDVIDLSIKGHLQRLAFELRC